RSAVAGAARGDRAHVQPRRRPPLRALLLFDLEAGVTLDLHSAEERFAGSTDFTVGIEEEFSILDPATLGLVGRFEQLRDAAADAPVLAESLTGELIASEIEIRSG